MIKGLVAGALGGGGYGGWQVRERYLDGDIRKRMEFLYAALEHEEVQISEQGHDGVATRIVVLIPMPVSAVEKRDQWSQDASKKLQWLQERCQKAYGASFALFMARNLDGAHGHISNVRTEDIDRFQRSMAYFHQTSPRSLASHFERQCSYFDALAAASSSEVSSGNADEMPVLLAYEEDTNENRTSLYEVASQWNKERISQWERPLHIVRLEFSRHFNPSPELAEHIAER